MAHKGVARITVIGMLLGAFTLGYFCASVTVPRASAQYQIPGSGQLPQIPGGIPTQSGGALNAVSQLGSSITDMEQHVSALQKNLDTLKKIQSVLGGK